MGTQLLDQYSLLHAAVGVVAYFWKIPLWIGVVIHAVFEWAENTEWGVRFLNTYIIQPGLFAWPGGKYEPDAIINQIGDVATFGVGWILASWLDRIGIQRGWYHVSQK